MNTATVVCLVIPFTVACVLLIGLLFGFSIFKQTANAISDTINDWLQKK